MNDRHTNAAPSGRGPSTRLLRLFGAGLLYCAGLASCADEQPLPVTVVEAETAVAEVLTDRKDYLDVTREELVASMEQRLAAYETVLDGIDELSEARTEEIAADRLDGLRRRVGDLRSRVLEVETALGSPWEDERNALVESASRLEDDVLALWRTVRP